MISLARDLGPREGFVHALCLHPIEGSRFVLVGHRLTSFFATQPFLPLSLAQDLLLRELLQQLVFRLTAFTLEERLFAMTERSLRLSEALGH